MDGRTTPRPAAMDAFLGRGKTRTGPAWLVMRMLNYIQLTLVISTSVISNNRLSRRENLIPVLT